MLKIGETEPLLAAAQEAEQLRVAHERHDSVQQSLTGLALTLSLSGEIVESNPGQARASVTDSAGREPACQRLGVDCGIGKLAGVNGLGLLQAPSERL